MCWQFLQQTLSEIIRNSSSTTGRLYCVGEKTEIAQRASLKSVRGRENISAAFLRSLSHTGIPWSRLMAGQEM